MRQKLAGCVCDRVQDGLVHFGDELPWFRLLRDASPDNQPFPGQGCSQLRFQFTYQPGSPTHSRIGPVRQCFHPSNECTTVSHPDADLDLCFDTLFIRVRPRRWRRLDLKRPGCHPFHADWQLREVGGSMCLLCFLLILESLDSIECRCCHSLQSPRSSWLGW